MASRGKIWQRLSSFRTNNLTYLPSVNSHFHYLILKPWILHSNLAWIYSYFFEVNRTWLNAVCCFKLIRRIHSFWVHGSIYIVGILFLIITYYTQQLCTSLLLYILWSTSRCIWCAEIKYLKVISKWNKFNINT